MVIARRSRSFPVGFVLALLALLLAAPAFPAGFGFFEQGAKATAMGGAFGGLADDPSALFYNPSGIGFQDHFEVMAGTTITTFTKSQFEGSNPFPGEGVTGTYHKTWFFPSHLYIVAPITSNVKFGFAAYTPFGLSSRWKDAEEWAGRFISQNASIQTVSLVPTLSFRLAPTFSLAANAEYRLSTVQLEKNEAAYDPFTQSFVDVAHVKLKSGTEHGWGWGASALWKPSPSFSLGASYKAKMTIDYATHASFTQRFTGNPVFDAGVAASLPNNPRAEASIDFPAIADFGFAWHCPGRAFTLTGDAVWTEWSTYKKLDIVFPDGELPTLHRETDWKDSWSYRVGVEQKFGGWAVRAGFVYDETPQPEKESGPLLPDSIRRGYCFGFGYNGGHWGFDIADMYLPFQDRTVHNSQDSFTGSYKLTANLIGVDFRLSF